MLGTALCSYLIGALNSALIISRLFHLADPRVHGSGNPGATNMARMAPKKLALLTLALDIGKGALAVWGAHLWSASLDLTDGPLPWVAGVMAVLGHIWPVWHHFRGGKGVATLVGVLLWWDLLLAATWAATFLLATLTSRNVAVGSVLGCVLLPVYAALLAPLWPLVVAVTILVVQIIYRHRSNLLQLREG